AVCDLANQQLASVSLGPSNIDLFVIGFDNRVYTPSLHDALPFYRNPDGTVNPDGHFFSLPGRAVFDREKQQLAAVSRGPGNIDRLVVDTDDLSCYIFWNDQIGWNRNTDGTVNPDGHFFSLPGRAV